MMHGREQSDGLVVPAKPRNNAGGVPAADGVEGRGSAKRNPQQPTTRRTQSRASVPAGLERVRQAARKDKDARFTALLHHVTPELLRESYLGLKRRAAPGVDGVTWQQYGQDLEANLRDLHARLHRGAYRPKPSRRAYVSKANGRMRPLGIAAVEDKVVQAAVATVLSSVWEQDFIGFSYGFRPGRSPHDALDALAAAVKRGRVNWILDADVRDFFSAVSHEWTQRFVEDRIADPRILRLIRAWLTAGVMEDGKVTWEQAGTVQGATISPPLANLYLHHVFDRWAHEWRGRHARGKVYLVRFADDIIVGFEHREDAERFRGELRERLAAFDLELNPEKTRLIEFGRFAARNRAARGLGKPENFTFLGFTHICGTSRKGGFQLVRQTNRTRLRRKLREIRRELRRRMHASIPEQGAWLRRVVQGHFNYYAVPTNIHALSAFRKQVGRHWIRTLRRRSQRGRRLTWQRMYPWIDRCLPRARILHPWPEDRFDARLKARAV
ncbi:MAG: group II intron reverse transcriptase/maturase [Acidobacteria bacterium]|nr:group II intron reverse transcriptase/maturase [Acidobacteriota bacterium]